MLAKENVKKMGGNGHGGIKSVTANVSIAKNAKSVNNSDTYVRHVQ